jgi:DNA circularisation protein N-terminus
MTVFDGFPQATFSGITFPVESSRIKGGIRDHVHEYPHSPGGSPEKLGRSLYEFTVQVHFDARFTNYPGLYPGNLNQLVLLFEAQTTADFRLPQMPKAVPSYCRSWTREMSNRVRSGEKAELLFIEDQSTLYLFQDLVSQQSSNLGGLSTSLSLSFSGLPFTPSAGFASLFQSISTFIGQIQGLAQIASVYGTELSDAVNGLINTCSSFDSDPQMQTVPAAALMEANHEIWAAAQAMANDIEGVGVQLQTWIVPMRMDIASVSMALFNGDSSFAGDLLALNPIDDPLLINAGTSLVYYPQAA